MDTHLDTCPACAATTRQTKAGKNRCGTQRLHCQRLHCQRLHCQRLHCRHCRRYYTRQPRKKGYPPETRRAALRLYVDGTNLRRTARLLGVAPQTVVNWVNAACDALPPRPAPAQAEVVELDELYTFVAQKKTSPMSARR